MLQTGNVTAGNNLICVDQNIIFKHVCLDQNIIFKHVCLQEQIACSKLPFENKTQTPQEYDQLKAQPAAEEKKAAKPEKKRKRIKIEEVAEDSDPDEKDAQPQQASATRPKSSGESCLPPPSS